ncbi:MAG: MFS transporter [Methanoregula sp.]|nr:MFS transporter [Methanoregula sp.]
MPVLITDSRSQRLLLGAIALGVVMDGIDGSIVNVALPTMAGYFGTDTGTIGWVIITYLLMMAGLLIVLGKLATMGCAKRLFLAGSVIFTIGSAACGIAPSLEFLLAARLLQGTGAAMIAAVAPLLCVRYLPEEMLGAAIGVIAAAASIGFAAGPAIGGILTQYLSWHWIFLVNIPIGLGGIIYSARVIPRDEPVKGAEFSDYPGAVVLFIAMASGTYVLEELAARGGTDPVVLAVGVLFLASSAAFIVREKTTPEPVLEIRIFREWRFLAVTVSYLLLNIVFMGVIYLLPFYFSDVLHLDPVMNGICLLVPPAVIALLSIPFGHLSDRHGRRIFTAIAGGIFVVYSAIFTLIAPAYGVLPLAAGLILMGVGFGIAAGPASSRIIEAAFGNTKETGSSLMVTVIYLGGVLGTAIYAMLFTFATAGPRGVIAFTELDPASFLSGFHLTMAAGVGLSVLALVLAAIVPDGKTGG